MSPRHGDPDRTRTQAMPAVRVPASGPAEPTEDEDIALIERALQQPNPYGRMPTHRELAAAVLAAQREAAMAACDCYPNGFTPATYEGPMPWCRTHGDPGAAYDAGHRQGYDEGVAAERQRLALRPDGTPWTGPR